jgi:N4-(beta-N-acetylglucosaminyl)-L-asparaginase
VGYGGSPDENGETTLDAMIMDGVTHDVGAVGALRMVKNAISVARAVLEHSTHTMLVGDQATAFAVEMGFNTSNLTTPDSEKQWEQWRSKNCQPNYWIDVQPDPTKNCGPYSPLPPEKSTSWNNMGEIDHNNHDTIGMVAIDINNNIAGGTSTNGLGHKIPGRVGDSPITGSGTYVDNDVGGCAATGDGDVMMRFLPCYHAVEKMRQGMLPKQAAEDAIRRIIAKYPAFTGAIVVLTKAGDHAGACHNWVFKYSVRNPSMNQVEVFTVQPIS